MKCIISIDQPSAAQPVECYQVHESQKLKQMPLYHIEMLGLCLRGDMERVKTFLNWSCSLPMC